MGFLIIFMAEEYFTPSSVCACSMCISCLQGMWREKKGTARERVGKRRRSHRARRKVGGPAHPVACCSHAWVVAPAGCALRTGHSLILYHERTRSTESLNRALCPPTSSWLSSPSFASATRNRKGHSENPRKPPAPPGSALLSVMPGTADTATAPPTPRGVHCSHGTYPLFPWPQDHPWSAPLVGWEQPSASEEELGGGCLSSEVFLHRLPVPFTGPERRSPMVITCPPTHSSLPSCNSLY